MTETENRPVETCPACGRPLPKGELPPITLLSVEDLVRAMDTPILGTRRGDFSRRDVYRGDKTNDWFVTYGGGRVAWETVEKAIARGLLQQTYPDCADCWTLVPWRFSRGIDYPDGQAEVQTEL